MEFDFSQIPDIRYTLEWMDLLTPEDWAIRISTQPLPVLFIQAFHRHLDIPCVFRNKHFTESELETILQDIHLTRLPFINERGSIKKYLTWRSIAVHQDVSVKFMIQYRTYLDWDILSKYQEWTLAKIAKCTHYINWEIVLRYHTFSERVLDQILEIFPVSNTDPVIGLTCNILFCRMIENPRTCLSTKWLFDHRPYLFYMSQITDGLNMPVQLGTSFDVDDWYDHFIAFLRRMLVLNTVKRRWRMWAHAPGGCIYEKRTNAIRPYINLWKTYTYRPPRTPGSPGGRMYQKCMQNFSASH